MDKKEREAFAYQFGNLIESDAKKESRKWLEKRDKIFEAIAEEFNKAKDVKKFDIKFFENDLGNIRWNCRFRIQNKEIYAFDITISYAVLYDTDIKDVCNMVKKQAYCALTKAKFLPYKEFRRDGWPLCPQCGNDELRSIIMLGWNGDEDTRPSLDQCLQDERHDCVTSI